MSVQSAVICNTPNCDAVFIIEKGEPRFKLISASHEAGWISRGINGVWQNHCDQCSTATQKKENP